MRLTINPTEDPTVLQGTGALDIYEVESTRATLIAHLAGQDGLLLDLKAVNTCDAAGAQLLCAAELEARQSGKSFVIKPSACIRECFEQLGLPLTSFAIPSAQV